MALGVEAINSPDVGLASAAQATVSNILSGAATVTNSVGGGGDSGDAKPGILTRLQNVIDPPPIPLKVSYQDKVQN